MKDVILNILLEFFFLLEIMMWVIYACVIDFTMKIINNNHIITSSRDFFFREYAVIFYFNRIFFLNHFNMTLFSCFEI